MKDKTKDQMSAFLDDELPEDQAELLLRRLNSDEELRRTAERYLLIGQVLRGEWHPGTTVREGVAQGLSAEASHEAREYPTSRWLRPAAGVGLAASVAVLALVGLQNSGENPGAAATSPPLVASQSPRFAVQSDSSDFEYTVPADMAATRGPAIAIPARLTNYMISHGERAGTLARNGMHSRVVTQRMQTMPASMDETNSTAVETGPDETQP